MKIFNYDVGTSSYSLFCGVITRYENRTLNSLPMQEILDSLWFNFMEWMVVEIS